jgi:hypothetical protein
VSGAIAFCPQPPLLVPELAAGAAAELDGLRAACRAAVERLLTSGPDRIVVLGPGPRTLRYPEGSTGTLAGYGVPVLASLGLPTGAAPALPPALTLGGLLLGHPGVPCAGQAVAADADPAEVAGTLTRPGTGLLVMADGSARRSEQAPGYVDPRAGGFDTAVAAALAGGDAALLAALDPVLGAELLAVGVPAWRVAGHAAAGLDLEADLLYESAPYGVGYFVASWIPR